MRVKVSSIAVGLTSVIVSVASYSDVRAADTLPPLPAPVLSSVQPGSVSLISPDRPDGWQASWYLCSQVLAIDGTTVVSGNCDNPAPGTITTLSSLTPETNYLARFFVSDPEFNRVAYGPTTAFTTASPPPFAPALLAPVLSSAQAGSVSFLAPTQPEGWQASWYLCHQVLAVDGTTVITGSCESPYPTPGSTLTLSSLTPETNYLVRFFASGDPYNRVAYGPTTAFTTASPPPFAPALLAPVLSSAQAGSVSFLAPTQPEGWQASWYLCHQVLAVDGTTVITGSCESPYPTPGSTLTLSSLTPETNYLVRFFASGDPYNRVAYGPTTAFTTASPPPFAPALLAPVLSSAQAGSVSFLAPTQPEGWQASWYLCHQVLAVDGTTVITGSCESPYPTPGSTLTLSSLTPETNYLVRFFASGDPYNRVAYGPTTAFTTASPPPFAPALLAPVLSSAQAGSVSFLAPTQPEGWQASWYLCHQVLAVDGTTVITGSCESPYPTPGSTLTLSSLTPETNYLVRFFASGDPYNRVAYGPTTAFTTASPPPFAPALLAPVLSSAQAGSVSFLAPTQPEGWQASWYLCHQVLAVDGTTVITGSCESPYPTPGSTLTLSSLTPETNYLVRFFASGDPYNRVAYGPTTAFTTTSPPAFPVSVPAPTVVESSVDQVSIESPTGLIDWVNNFEVTIDVFQSNGTDLLTSKEVTAEESLNNTLTVPLTTQVQTMTQSMQPTSVSSSVVAGTQLKVRMQVRDRETNYIRSSSMTAMTVGQSSLTPSLVLASRTTSSVTINLTNFDSNYTFAITSSQGRLQISAPVGSTQQIKVSRLTQGQYVTINVTATRVGYAMKSTTMLSRALLTGLTPTTSRPVSTSTGFTFNITNYDPNYTFTISSSRGSVVVGTPVGTLLPVSVTGLNSREKATLTMTTTREDYTSVTVKVTGQASR